MHATSGNKMSRRRFLSMASAGLAAGGLYSLMGCQSAPPTSPEAPGAAPAAATTPGATVAVSKPAGATQGLKTLRFASAEPQGPQETLDPAFGLQHMDRICSIYDQLVELDDSFKPQPMLAESWDFNDKADVWTFKLRQDVKFHDGSKFTAKDVVYTYRRILDPETASPGAAALAGISPDGIEALDDYTVRFTLPQPMVDLPVTLNNKFTYIVKEGVITEDLRQTAVGTGPFKVERFVPGEDPCILVKNENYWRSGRPAVDVLELRSIAEAAARVAALSRDQVDIIEEAPLNELENLQANSALNVISQRSGDWEAFVMMVDQEPFIDNRVRLALKSCLNREQMVQLILRGHGNAANDVPVPAWFEYALQDPPRGQDIAQAKALLAEAGYTNGITLEVWTSSIRQYWNDMCAVLKEMVAEAGITIEIKTATADTYWTEVWMKKPFCMTGWSARPADGILSEAFLSTAEWNETHWKRADWDELILKARQTVDYEQRKITYQQAQKMIVEEGGVLIPFFVDTLAATRATVTGWKPQARRIFYDFSVTQFAV